MTAAELPTVPDPAGSGPAVPGPGPAVTAEASPAASPAASRAAVKPRRRRRRPPTGVLIAAGWLAVIVLVAVIVPLLPGCDPLRGDFAHPSAAPGPGHWFGTDANGRDVFYRTAAGARASFAVAGLTVLVGLLVGGGLGVAAGWFGGWTDRVIGFAADILMSVPSMILIMIVVSLRGPSLPLIGTLIGALTIPAFMRISRASVLALAEHGFVQAARMIGTSPARILRREVVPHMAPVAVTFAFTATTVAIVAEGALSFLGFSLPPPEPTWGGIIAEGRTTLGSAPWISLAPAIVLCLTVLAFNYLGEHLRSGNPKEGTR